MKKNTKKTATIDTDAKVYPKWAKADTRAASDKMNDAQYALCQARDAWVAAGKPNTPEHIAESARLQLELDETTKAFSILSRRDLSAFFAAI
ncbi:MAG TPA: hypothetical protein VLA31_04245 [Burkholderiaceae bacterium]|nr:hypothetical protein [Burkholderiaceae bacterium]